MIGKDIIFGLKDVSDIVIEEAEFGSFPVNASAHRRQVRIPLLIAAIIGLIMLLVGCGAYFYSLKQLVLTDHTNQVVAIDGESRQEEIPEGTDETSTETSPAPFVSEIVLSLQGYEGSPSYHALQEWWEYAIDYTIKNPDLRFTSDYQRPEAYTKYPCYSQDMVDKVDEICSKYGLHLLGKVTFISDADGMEEKGLSGVLSEEAALLCFCGHLCEDGSFTVSGELEFSGDYEKTVQFQMRNIRKDAFCTSHLGLDNMSDYIQWNYTTADGHTALLALSDRTGLIFVETEGRFVSVIIEEVPDDGAVFCGLPREEEFLELVCDCFVFPDLTTE